MKFRSLLASASLLALAGCNQYSTPAIQSSTAPGQDGATGRSTNPLNNQADPGETTGSIGGSPGGTSSVQTVPSSSNGVR